MECTQCSGRVFIFGPVNFIFGPVNFIFGPVNFIFGPVNFIFGPVNFIFGPVNFIFGPVNFIFRPVNFIFGPAAEIQFPRCGGGGREGGGQSFTNFRHYIALLGLRLHTALRKPL